MWKYADLEDKDSALGQCQVHTVYLWQMVEYRYFCETCKFRDIMNTICEIV